MYSDDSKVVMGHIFVDSRQLSIFSFFRFFTMVIMAIDTKL